MSKDEREAFLAGLHVGVISIAEEGRGPLAVPVWYRYEPGGDVCIVIGRKSRKALLIEQAGRFSLCVQTEQPPYEYVSIEGPVVATGPVDPEADLRPMARRYLGSEIGDYWMTSVGYPAQASEDILVRMRPERWFALDTSKLLSNA
jgi:nitroimidazol reductase NimA-like FMN-containing flavoprotein (pyridoxamine 5'-phosphate oxidase superfamily)